MKKLLHSITFHIIGGVICVVLLMIDIALAECLTAHAALDEYVMVTGFHLGVSGELYVQTARRGVLCYKNGEYIGDADVKVPFSTTQTHDGTVYELKSSCGYYTVEGGGQTLYQTPDAGYSAHVFSIVNIPVAAVLVAVGGFCIWAFVFRSGPEAEKLKGGMIGAFFGRK